VRLRKNKLVLLLAAGALLLCAADRSDAPHSVVAGTVFRENGFSLPGAALTVAVKDLPGAPKMKKIQSVSSPRGEFAFRVPPGAATYVVKASMKGFQSVEKEASVSADERVEVTLVLPAESK